MTTFTLHTPDTAPEHSRELLQASQKSYGFVPNLHAVMAGSPQLLECYQKLHAEFQKTSLSVIERHVVWLTINVEHQCHYCVPAHTMIAMMQGVDDQTLAALRDNTPLADARLEALRQFTLLLLRNRGMVDDAAVQRFFAAGYTQRQVLDILLGLAQKVMSNYVNHLAQTPIDPAFAEFAWTPVQ